MEKRSGTSTTLTLAPGTRLRVRREREHELSPSRPLSRSWFIAHERKLRLVVLVIAAVTVAIQWVRAGLLVQDGDFYLHWQFATRFVHHELLYANGLHVPYPPFWAMAWSPIAALPLAVAKVACFPLSLAAVSLVLWILNRLTREHLPLSSAKQFWATVAALAIVSRFLVRELPECGPNLLLLALCWSGIFLWTRNRDIPAGICLGLATAMKCTPAIFIAYFAWKRQWKLAMTGLVAAAALFLAPALWQGPLDYQWHIEIWLTHLKLGAGQADPMVGVLGPETLQNLSLRPALARWLMHLPVGHPSHLDHAAYLEFLDLSPQVAGRIVKFTLLALVACVAWVLRRPITRRDALTIVWECSAIGALALLLSPITWYQHCVALLPVFYLFTRTVAARGRPATWMLAVVAFFLLIVVVLSRGLIGRDATLILASYHLTTWAICGALALAIGGLHYERARLGAGESDRTTRSPSFPPSFSLSCLSASGVTNLLVAVGLLLRLYHYLRDPSLWHDEANLVINVLDKTFAELLGPLRFSEAAPPLFLWLEKCVSVTLGESLFALRFLPLGASCGALLLFVPVARRMLQPAAVPWAVLLFSVSDRLLWHTCEAKQYAIEAFISVLLLAVWLLTDSWRPWRRAILLAVLAPPLLGLAYPAVFVYGGLLIVLLLDVRRSRRARDWFGFGLVSLTVLATFGWLLAGPIHAQRDTTIVTYWSAINRFPDWAHPASVPLWIIRSTCDVVGYCIKPVGDWLAPLAAGGIVLLWRQKRRDACLLLAVPVLLALVASFIKAYPYGGMRVMIYAAPAVFLLVAAGAVWCTDQLARRNRWLAAALIALLLVPVARAGYCVVRPWERADCAAAASYVAAHRQPDDFVVANHWEYLYYFRGLGRNFAQIETLSFPRERMWVVVTGATPSDRALCLALFSLPTWTIRDRQEFDRTTVLLVERGHNGLPSALPPIALRP